MSSDLQEMVKLKKSLWYKCRHSGFKQDQLVEEYKSLNKTTKKSQKSMRKLIFFKKTWGERFLNPLSIHPRIPRKIFIKL